VHGFNHLEALLAGGNIGLVGNDNTEEASGAQPRQRFLHPWEHLELGH
jgi:hypothetical protein